MKVHSRFVNIVRFSPDGELFCTGSADCKAFLFNGKTAEKIGSLGGDKAHSGGIYCVRVFSVCYALYNIHCCCEMCACLCVCVCNVNWQIIL